jgi:hypothetical protein
MAAAWQGDLHFRCGKKILAVIKVTGERYPAQMACMVNR